MGGPYNIPRNYKGEDKILFIFSRKAFLYTAITGLIGVAFYYIFKSMNMEKVGYGFVIGFGLIGFIVGTFKIPETNKWAFTRKVGGEQIDDVILRWIKFKRKKRKIYVYKEEGTKDVK